jgi:hypothetical protein
MSAVFDARSGRLLLAILGVAAFFRLWGVAFGMPYDGVTYDALTIEEIQEIHRALKLGAGEYSPVFGKGGLYLILFVEYGIYFIVAKLAGWVHSARDFALQALQDRTTIYVIGRVTVAAMGVATCYVVYRLARRLFDDRTALFAAVIGSLAYYHAVFSGVVNVDIGATLGLWLSLLIYLRYEDTGRTWLLAATGAMVAVATAFKTPGGVALPLVWTALITAPEGSPASGGLLKKCSIVFVAMAIGLTIIAPEWVFSLGNIVRYNFGALVQNAYAATDDAELTAAIKSITVMREGWKTGYLQHLTSPYNVALTVAAAYGGLVGMLKKNRWDTILFGTVVAFIVVMSLSDRTQPERYLLPIVPALWILGARGAAALEKYWNRLPILALAAIVSVPTYWLVRATVEKSQQDTRILAKEWIERNIPAGSKILMDGMRYRFSQGPPINADDSTISAKVEKAREEGGNFGRGVSELALSIFEQASSAVRGPKYRLVSTVHGLAVKDLDFYVSECFDYVITSSIISGRFRPGGPGFEQFPGSVAFYQSLERDPRVRLVHQETASPWRESGPTIRIFRLSNECSQN